MYETVDVQGSPEVRATATAKVNHACLDEQLSEFLFSNWQESACNKLAIIVCVTLVMYLQATVAAFAASEGQGHPRVVELEKVGFK